jgi:hypothetical protein
MPIMNDVPSQNEFVPQRYVEKESSNRAQLLFNACQSAHKREMLKHFQVEVIANLTCMKRG